MARAKSPGIFRPPCPQGHEGSVQLDGRSRTKDGLHERTRFRCVPHDRGEKEHVYLGLMPSRREGASVHAECPHCERPFHRAEGLAGGWRFRFVVREIALALTRIGRGESYRLVSRDMRKIVGRKSARGRRKGLVSKDAHLAINYIDAYAKVVTEALAPDEWPAIVLLDAMPIYVRDHTDCCGPYRAKGQRPPRHADTWGPPEDEDDGEGKRRPKIAHAAPAKEVGRIFVAVGMRHAGDLDPSPVLIRFAGGGDQASWAEFLRTLPGQPEWVVSDRDKAISAAVQDVWGDGGTTHYFCEQHIATNGAEKAIEDGIGRGEHHEFWEIFERAQFSREDWTRLEGAASVLRVPKLRHWMHEIGPLMEEQWAKRRQFYPRSASACEAVIRRIGTALDGRQPFFRNADRLNLLLGLATLEYAGVASEARYSKLIREIFVANEGRAAGDWFELRDPAGSSSMRELVEDAAERMNATKPARYAPRKAEYHRERQADFETELRILGAKPMPQDGLRILRAQRSVAGKTLADFDWLVAQFHETLNGDRKPNEVLAGSGERIWWRCPEGPDHEWQAQVRSRTMRGAGCRFCAHKEVAPSDSLEVRFPAIAAQWHPTRNGEKRPATTWFAAKYAAWWQCSAYKTHAWRMRVSTRTSLRSGCTLCAGLKRPAAHKGALTIVQASA